MSSPALELLHGLVLEDDRRWGEAAESWQIEDAVAFLEPRDGPRLHFLTRGRAASKTTDLAAVAIAALVEQAPARVQGYAVAADAGQAELLVQAAGGLVARTPGLGGAIEVQTRRLVTPSGAAVNVLPADDASAWGLRPWLVIVDELAQWRSTPGPRNLWTAVVSALPKVPGARLAVLTTGGDPAHWSYKILERARRSELWRVHEVPGPAPWVSETELDEQRGLLPASVFARVSLNIWTAGEDALVDREALARCVRLDCPQPYDPSRRPYVIGVDLGLKRDRTVAAVCHVEPEQVTRSWGGIVHEAGFRVVLDRLEVWTPRPLRPVRLDDVESWLLQAADEYRADVVLDPWQAIGLAQRLRARYVHVEEFSFNQAATGRLASTLHMLLRDARLSLPDDPDLLDELANVRLRETSPGVFRMDHEAGRHDDRAIALALAAQWLLEHGPGTGRVARLIGFYDPNRRTIQRAVHEDELERMGEKQRIATGIAAMNGDVRIVRRAQRHGAHAGRR